MRRRYAPLCISGTVIYIQLVYSQVSQVLGTRLRLARVLLDRGAEVNKADDVSVTNNHLAVALSWFKIWKVGQFAVSILLSKLLLVSKSRD